MGKTRRKSVHWTERSGRSRKDEEESDFSEEDFNPNRVSGWQVEDEEAESEEDNFMDEEDLSDIDRILEDIEREEKYKQQIQQKNMEKKKKK